MQNMGWKLQRIRFSCEEVIAMKGFDSTRYDPIRYNTIHEILSVQKMHVCYPHSSSFHLTSFFHPLLNPGSHQRRMILPKGIHRKDGKCTCTIDNKAAKQHTPYLFVINMCVEIVGLPSSFLLLRLLLICSDDDEVIRLTIVCP